MKTKPVVKTYFYAVRFAYSVDRHRKGDLVSRHRTRAAAEKAAKRCNYPSFVEIVEL